MTPGEQRKRASSPVARELKRHLLTLVGGVVVLHAAAIVIYYTFHIRDRPNKTQQVFVAVWVAATLILVTTLMKRIRQARRRRS
jgi:chromate transport protein ChrA